jgi:hypothetical protein
MSFQDYRIPVNGIRMLAARTDNKPSPALSNKPGTAITRHALKISAMNGHP